MRYNKKMNMWELTFNNADFDKIIDYCHCTFEGLEGWWLNAEPEMFTIYIKDKYEAATFALNYLDIAI